MPLELARVGKQHQFMVKPLEQVELPGQTALKEPAEQREQEEHAVFVDPVEEIVASW